MRLNRDLARLGCGLTLLAWVGIPAQAQDLQASARLDPADVLGLGEVAVLEIKVDVAGGQQFRLDPKFELDNLRVVGGPFQSTSLRIVNGAQSMGQSLSWQLQPLAVGKASVRNIQVHAGDQVIELAAKTLDVVAEPPPRSRRRGGRPSDPFGSIFGDEDPFAGLLSERRRPRSQRPAEPPQIFLRAEARPQDPWVGQQVTYTLYLYTETDVHSINPVELPEFKGFWVQKIPQPEQLQPEMIDLEGKRFGRVELLQWALFPRRAGTYQLEPVTARMAARFLDDAGPFGGLLPQTREVTRVSNAVELRVRDLPAAAPAGFQGAVGELGLEAQLTPTRLTVGEATTLTLEIKGKGHFQGIPEPQLPQLAGLKVFPPQQQSDEGLRGKNVVSTQKWSFVLVPERPGEWTLPPLELPYFDPQSERYQVARSASLTLTAQGPTQLTQDSGEKVELHGIRTALLPAPGTSLLSRLLSPWALILPWGLIAVLLVWQKRRSGGAHTPALRQASKRLLADLASAEKDPRPRETAARIEDAWRQFLLVRFAIPLGTPSTQWAELLTVQGTPAEAARDLVGLADDLHYLRYAPKLSSVDELRQELFTRSRKLARLLR